MVGEYLISLTREEWEALRGMVRVIHGKWGEHGDELDSVTRSILGKLGFSASSIESLRTGG